MVKFDVRRNYYEDLELGPSAETEEIKKQFRKLGLFACHSLRVQYIALLIICALHGLALKYHPDRNPGRESEFFTKFQAIQVAHEILCDPRQRFKYDTERLGAGYGRLYQNAASQENTSSYAAGKTATPKPSRRASSQQPSLDKAQRYANFPEAAPQQTEADASRAFRAMLLPKTVSSNFDPSGPEGGQSRTSTRGRSTTRNNLGTQTNSGSSSDEAARAQASMAQTQPPVSAEAWAQRLQDTEWAVPNPNSEYAQPHEKTSSTRQGRNISRPTSRTTRPQQPAVSTEADEDEATIPEPVQGNSTSILDAMEIDKETQPNKMVTSDFKQSQLSKSKANVSVVNSDQASEQKSDLFNLGNLHEIEPFASTKDSKMDDLEVYETSADSSDKLSFPSPERSSIPMTSVPTIFSQNSKEVDSQDTETIYSEISMVSATAKHKGYIIELASEIANEILRDQLDDRTMERIISVFPGLIKGFALRIGYRASTQMHRDVMFFAHKHRK
jgi:curved DNA-binding protein CbpA